MEPPKIPATPPVSMPQLPVVEPVDPFATMAAKGFIGLEIPDGELMLLDELSKDADGEDIGRYGKVYRGRLLGLEVAVKIPKVQELTPEQLEKFRLEVKINSELSHPNIVRFLGASLRPGHFRLVTELLSGGNLSQLLMNPQRRLSLTQKLKLARDIAKGLLYLHASDVIHLDLKPENVLLDSNMTAKLSDFGLSACRPTREVFLKGGPKGTPLWMSPEMLTGRDYNEKTDVYSFGIILWQLLSREEPYSQFTDLTQFIKAVAIGGHRPTIPQGTSPNLSHLIMLCWHPIPTVRPSFNDIDQQMLPLLLIESAILDEIGRNVWRSHFLSRDSVKWEEFAARLYAALGLTLDIPTDEVLTDDPLPPNATDAQLHHATMAALEKFTQCGQEAFQRAVDEVKRRQGHGFYTTLQKLLTVKTNDQLYVTLERFGMILALFGPLSTEQPLAIFDRMSNILPRPWFFGAIDTSEAFDLLATKPPGTYLVRFSSNVEFVGFVISLVDGNRTVVHIRIKHLPGQPHPFVLQGERTAFSSLDDLIVRNSNLLREPCQSDASPYMYLFHANAFTTGRAARGGYVSVG